MPLKLVLAAFGGVALSMACGSAPRTPTEEPRSSPRRGPAERGGPPLAAAPECVAEPEPDRELRARLEQAEARIHDLERALEAGRDRRPVPSHPPVRGPDPDAVFAVPIDGNPFVGPRYAPVTMVVGFSFTCPFSNRIRITLDQLRSHYGDDLKIVYKHYIIHPQAGTIPAHAACAAHRQGRFPEMFTRIFTDGFEAGRDFSRDRMLEIARKIGLKIPRFRADMNSAACARKAEQDQAQLHRVGQRGTPASYINGRYLSGAHPIDRFKKLIDEELAKARASNIPTRKYYDHILSTGLTKHEAGD